MNFLPRPRGAAMAGVICTVMLFGMIGVHAWPLWAGQTILLPVVPVDPRDLFRGDYVRLDTPATRLTTMPESRIANAIPVKLIGAGWDSWSRDPRLGCGAPRNPVVYVQFEHRRSPYPEPVSISHVVQPGRINLRGRLSCRGWTGQDFAIDYGLDRYFVQEKTGKRVEDALAYRRRVDIEVAVTESGRTRIRRLLIDGVPFEP